MIDVLKANYITTTFPIHLPVASLQIRLLHYGVMDGHVTNIRGEAVAGIVRAPYGQTIGATRLAVLAKHAAQILTVAPLLTQITATIERGTKIESSSM